MSSEIRDINLAESGERKIEWVRRNCDLLRTLEEEFSKTKPFAGKKIALSVHLEAKTAYLCLVLNAGGAEMYVTLEPCPMCGWAILQSRIKILYFGSYDNNYGAFSSKIDLREIASTKLNVYGGILEKECDEVLKEFFKKLRV